MFQLIKLLLDSGFEVDIRDNQDRTPLHFAVVANRISVLYLFQLIKLLLDSDAAVDIRDNQDNSTTFCCCR